MRLATFLLCAFLCCAHTAAADTQSSPADIGASPVIQAWRTENAERLTANIDATLADAGAPGLTLSVVVDGELAFELYRGLADKGASRPVTAETAFRIGSITKMFTATSALIAERGGLLNMDARVIELLPELEIDNAWEPTYPLRLRDLMQHTAGFDDMRPRDYAMSDSKLSTLEGILYSRSTRVARWAPGTRWSYSNIGPAVMAYAIEKSSLIRFEDYVAEQIFEPLGLSSLSYFQTSRTAKSYGGVPVASMPYVNIIARASGALEATAQDMAVWVKVLAGRGELELANGRRVRLLSQADVERMEQASGTLANEQGVALGHGLANFSENFEGFRFQGHGGGIDGFGSMLEYLPEHNRGYFFSLNAVDPKAYPAIRRALRVALIDDLSAPALKRRDTQVNSVTSVVALPEAGYYQSIAPRSASRAWIDRLFTTRILTHEGQGFELSGLGAEEAKRYVPAGEAVFRRNGERQPAIAMVRLPNSETALQGDIGTFQRVSGIKVWGERVIAGWGVACVFGLLLVGTGVGLTRLVRRLFERDQRSEQDTSPSSPDVELSTGSLALALGPGGRPSGIVRWPMAASASILLSAVLLALAIGQMFEPLGRLSLHSLGYFVGTLLFPIFTTIGLVRLWVTRRQRSPLWWLTLFLCTGCAVLAVYFGANGLLGVRYWVE